MCLHSCRCRRCYVHQTAPPRTWFRPGYHTGRSASVQSHACCVGRDETVGGKSSNAAGIFSHTHATTSVPTLCAFRASPANTHLHRVDRRALIATHAFVTWITARPYELGRTQRSIGRSSLVCSARHRTRPHLGTWHYVWIGCTHSARCLYGCLQRVPQVESGCESARRG